MILNTLINYGDIMINYHVNLTLILTLIKLYKYNQSNFLMGKTHIQILNMYKIHTRINLTIYHIRYSVNDYLSLYRL